MGRNAVYSAEEILDAASAIAARGGAHSVTMTAIASALGAPSGSLYHRFASRDLVMASLWIRTVQRFQVGFLEAFAQSDLSAVVNDAVLHTIEWSEQHRDEAAVLLLHSQRELMARQPEGLGDQLAALNSRVATALRRFTEQHFGETTAETIGRSSLALIELPYAAVRPRIASGESTPSWLRASVLDASRAVLGMDRAA
jgi:AcrR family transcriptional regulator